MSLPNGLYRRSTDWTYYEVRDGVRYGIPTREAFESTFGAADDKVQPVDPAVLNAVPERAWDARGVGPLSDGLYRYADGPEHFHVVGGYRFHIPDEAEFVAAFGSGGWDRVVPVDRARLNRIPAGVWERRAKPTSAPTPQAPAPVYTAPAAPAAPASAAIAPVLPDGLYSAPGDGRVFVVQSGVKSLAPSRAALLQSFGDSALDKVQPAPVETLSRIPDAPFGPRYSASSVLSGAPAAAGGSPADLLGQVPAWALAGGAALVLLLLLRK
jgi:hypothetical protein